MLLFVFSFIRLLFFGGVVVFHHHQHQRRYHGGTVCLTPLNRQSTITITSQSSLRAPFPFPFIATFTNTHHHRFHLHPHHPHHTSTTRNNNIVRIIFINNNTTTTNNNTDKQYGPQISTRGFLLIFSFFVLSIFVFLLLCVSNLGSASKQTRVRNKTNSQQQSQAPNLMSQSTKKS